MAIVEAPLAQAGGLIEVRAFRTTLEHITPHVRAHLAHEPNAPVQEPTEGYFTWNVPISSGCVRWTLRTQATPEGSQIIIEAKYVERSNFVRFLLCIAVIVLTFGVAVVFGLWLNQREQTKVLEHSKVEIFRLMRGLEAMVRSSEQAAGYRLAPGTNRILGPHDPE
jgi:hypothetical protein